MTRYDRWTDDLQVQGQTPPVPALPYIAPLGADIVAYREALTEATANLPREARERLNIYGFAPMEPADYTALEMPPPLPIRQ